MMRHSILTTLLMMDAESDYFYLVVWHKAKTAKKPLLQGSINIITINCVVFFHNACEYY